MVLEFDDGGTTDQANVSEDNPQVQSVVLGTEQVLELQSRKVEQATRAAASRHSKMS